MVAKNTLFCFGYGYVAQYVGDILRLQDYTIIGTHRAETACQHGEWLLQWHASDAIADTAPPSHQWLNALQQATHIFISIPPDAAGCPVFRQWGAYLATLPNLQWVGYCSTTGVYGDWEGQWVTETSELLGIQPRQRYRIQAEHQWQQSGLPVAIFRISGIYGPGRNTLEQLRTGQARCIHKPDHVFSRAHVLDIATLITCSAQQRRTGIYNVADDEPSSSAEVVRYAAALLQRPCPPEEHYNPATLSPMLRSFYEGCRRVSNQKAKEELGWFPRYPSYREGLRHCL